MKNGGGPRTPAQPMDAFAAEFLDRQARHWKPATRETNAYIVRKHILPAFGGFTVDAIAVEQVRDWFAAMSEGPGLANRAMPVLSMMMRTAELWGYCAHNSNPGRNTRRYRMKPMERFLTADEMARLNAVLTRDEFWCPHIVAIVRLLMLTGCRFGEIAALEWDWIRDKRIYLPDSKSGPRTVWLSSAARAVIDTIPRYSADCPYLFPARPPTRPIDNIAFQWDRIRTEAGLPGLRLHDLCHGPEDPVFRQDGYFVAAERGQQLRRLPAGLVEADAAGVAHRLPNPAPLVLAVDEETLGARGQDADAEALKVAVADVVWGFAGPESLDPVLAEADIGHGFPPASGCRRGRLRLQLYPRPAVARGKTIAISMP